MRHQAAHDRKPLTTMASCHGTLDSTRLGLDRTIYIWCIYGILGREITNYTVVYGVYIYGSGQPIHD